MATTDIPGTNPANKDKLGNGSWAEHDDGSLIYVKDIDENDTVIFEIYELSDTAHPVFYQHALAKKDFEKTFSYDPKNTKGTTNIKWLWHDRTPFPWSKVMKYIARPVPVPVNVEDTISAAQRVANSLKAKMFDLTEDHVLPNIGVHNRTGKTSKTILQRLSNAIAELVN